MGLPGCMRMISKTNARIGVLRGKKQDKLKPGEHWMQFFRYLSGQATTNSSVFLITSHDSGSGTIRLGDKGQLIVEFPNMHNEIGFHLGNKAHELISNELRGSCIPSIATEGFVRGKSRKS